MSLNDLMNVVSGKVEPQTYMKNYRLAPIIGAANAGKPYDYPVPSEIYRPNMVILQVAGESMTTLAPDSLRDGDWLMVDTTVKSLKENELFVLEIIGDGYTVKRARKLNGDWLLMSDNPEYPILKQSEVSIIGIVFEAIGKRHIK